MEFGREEEREILESKRELKKGSKGRWKR